MTGASKLYRFKLETKKLESLSNTETGLFRPMQLPDEEHRSLRVFTSQGFRLVKLPVKVIEDVNAIPMPRRVCHRKISRSSKAGLCRSRNNIDDLKLRTFAGVYHPLRNMDLQSIYPIAQGYQDDQALGLRMDMGDSLGVSHIASTLSYSPTGPGPAGLRDRFHVGLEANYWDWKLSAYLNKADFYDLFGPTKVGRRGYALTVEKSENLLHDSDRTLDWTTNLSGYSGLDKLPDYQNIIATHTQVVTASSTLAYSNLQRSLGAIEDESGTKWNIYGELDDTFPKLFPQIRGDYARGFLLPLRNSSLWLRTSAGRAFGNENDPFANFYFGAFGNNWIDKGEISRYREYYSFPGVQINQIGAQSFVKGQAEWDLTPLHFRDLGSTKLYFNWARLALFAGGLAANPGTDQQSGYGDLGGQIDVRMKNLWLSLR